MAQKPRMCKQVGNATPEKMYFKTKASDTATCSPSFRAEISGSVPGTAFVTNVCRECRTVTKGGPRWGCRAADRLAGPRRGSPAGRVKVASAWKVFCLASTTAV